jgi:RNA polymerase sigma factor (sigma-70 family)
MPRVAARSALAELDDRDLLSITRALPQTSERGAAAREMLVTRHGGLVRSCVARYRHGPEPAEDLMQVGYVGLMKAINMFDPAAGGNLAAYAEPTIRGGLRRHFRDKQGSCRHDAGLAARSSPGSRGLPGRRPAQARLRNGQGEVTADHAAVPAAPDETTLTLWRQKWRSAWRRCSSS